MKYIEIWQPRWHDKKVLVAKFRIRPEQDVFIEIKESVWKGKYRIDYQDIVASDVETMKTKAGGKIEVIAVPLDKIKKIEEDS